MKKMVKTLACVLTTAALLFAVTGCPKATDDTTEETPAAEDWGTEIKNDDVSGAFIKYTDATVSVKTGDGTDYDNVTGIVANEEWASTGVTYYDHKTGVLSLVSENGCPQCLKFVPSNLDANKWYISTWISKNDVVDNWSSKVVSMKFYVSNVFAATSENDPAIKIYYKGADWGEKSLYYGQAADLKAGWHTFTIDYKNKSAKMDSTAVTLDDGICDNAAQVNEIGLVLDASAGAMPTSMKDGYLLIESVSVADAAN